MLLLVAFAGTGIVALVVVIAVIALSGGGGNGGEGNSSVAAAMRAAGCTYRDTPSIVAPESHVSSLDEKVHYGTGKAADKNGVYYWTYPPANGVHYQSPAVWGFYDEAVNVLQVVHNEEHGGLIIWWGPKVPSSEVDQLRDWYQKDPVSELGTPAPQLGDKIALTAWTGDPSKYTENGDFGEGHVAICPRFDEGAFDKFKDTYKGRSPEGTPESANQPGT